MAESLPATDGLGLAELKSLLVQAYEKLAQQDAEIAALREELARVKGLKGHPQLKPSGMEQSTQGRAKGKRKCGRRGPKRSKVTIDETKVIKPENVEAGARFKGYEDFIVQDIIVQPRTVLYRRERWQLPSGETVVAPLPAGTIGHFGAELKRFIIAQYVQGQATVPRLVSLLNDIGIVISKRQVMRLLSHQIRKKAKRHRVTYSFLFMKASGDQLREISALIDSGAIRPVVDRIFPFESTNEAMAYVETDGPKAKSSSR